MFYSKFTLYQNFSLVSHTTLVFFTNCFISIIFGFCFVYCYYSQNVGVVVFFIILNHYQIFSKFTKKSHFAFSFNQIINAFC